VRNPACTPKPCAAPLTAIKRRKVSKRLEAREEKIGAPEFANNGLRPMPNAMRLKYRRFIFILCPSIKNRHHAIALEMIRAPYQPRD
jgi:hypothetical protein